MSRGGHPSAERARRRTRGSRTALDALEALAAAHGLSKAVTWPVEVSLDEVLANVVRHGLEGRGEAATVELELRLDPGAEPPGLRGAW